MPNFGVSFVPGGEAADQPGGPRGRGGASGTSPVQQAIRFLSLRLPRFAGPGAIAPPGLLNARGAGGMPPAIVEALLRLAGQDPAAAMGQDSADAMPGPMGPGSVASMPGPMGRRPMTRPRRRGQRMAVPRPRVIPGILPGGGPTPLPQPAPRAPFPTPNVPAPEAPGGWGTERDVYEFPEGRPRDYGDVGNWPIGRRF